MSKQSNHASSINILIDGYNLLHQSSVMQAGTGAAWLNQQRVRLIETLARTLTPAERLATVCIFDAHTDRSPNTTDFVLSDIRVRFAHQHHEADDMIEDIIDNHPTPKTLLVVSSDRRIQLGARYRQAKSVTSRDWLDQLNDRADNARVENVQVANSESDIAEGYRDPESEKHSSSGSYDVESWSQYLMAEKITMTDSSENRPKTSGSKNDRTNAGTDKPAPKRSKKKAPTKQATSAGSSSKKKQKSPTVSTNKSNKLSEDSGIDPKILKRANRKLPDNGPIFPEDYFDGIS